MFIMNVKINYIEMHLRNILFRSNIKMNGEVLKLRSNGDLPPFRPKILDSTDPIILSPYSMVFMVIHGIQVPACST